MQSININNQITAVTFACSRQWRTSSHYFFKE